MKTWPKQSTGIVLGILAIALLLMPFSLIAQGSEDKTQVEPGNKRIMLITPETPEGDSLTIKVAPRDSISRALQIKLLRQLKKNEQINASLHKPLIPAGKQVIGVTHTASLNRFLDERLPGRSAPFSKPPVRIQTQALDGRVAVFIENTTEETIRGLTVSIDRLPDGWSAEMQKKTVQSLAPGHSAQFAFTLSGGALPRRVGFTFSTGDTLAIYWGARVKLANTAAYKKTNLPQKFKIYANYPDPFTASTTLSYALPQPMKVKIVIYNILGRRVAMLVNKRQPAGWHNMTWTPAELASGLYLCRMKATTKQGKKIVKEIKMMLIK